jgi:hypothetical protein
MNVGVNKTIVLKEADAASQSMAFTDSKTVTASFSFNDISAQFSNEFSHTENEWSDFDNEPLTFHMNSTEGPRLAVADVNGDGLEDVYICEAKNSAKKLFLQKPGGVMVRATIKAFDEDERCEDVDALFFDADNDKDQDLYVVSGGNEYSANSSALSDRLYINDGFGNFKKSPQLLPTNKFESTSCVAAADMNGDGDTDLFVGVRLKFRNYGIPQNGYLLENDGKGNFKNVTDQVAPGLTGLGLIKDACFADYNGDKQMDLIVAGEWMTIHLFENNNGYFADVTKKAGLSELSGWWNRIISNDLDGDGDLDFIAGNHGLNSRFKASREKPVTCYVSDFDENGTVEQIISAFNGDKDFPMVLWHDLVVQLPYLKKNYLKYEDYKEKRMQDLFTPQQLNGAIKHIVTTLESVVLINDGKGKFTMIKLPLEAQVAPVYGIAVSDFNGDDKEDILLGGNLFEVKPEIGKYDASYGTLLLGNGDGTFNAIQNNCIGLYLKGQVRDIVPFKLNSAQVFLVALNNEKMQILQTNRKYPKVMAGMK